MKKKRINIFLNIAVLCMCVCALAIGVYSAKHATLNVSGTIGFSAHDCEVAISGVMNAYTENANGTNDAVVKYFNKTKSEGGEANIIKEGGLSNTWDIGSVCFDDLNVDKYHYVNDICFTFNITNNSAFYVDVTVDQKCINNNRIYIYAPNNGETLAPKGQDGSSITLIVKIQLEKDANGEYSALSTPLDLSKASSLLNFKKSQAPAYLGSNWRAIIFKEFLGVADSDVDSAWSESTKVSFLREINDTILNGFDKNADGTYKYVSVGAINETSNAGNLTNAVSDVVAYYKSTSKEVIVYSPARIYAPQNCQTLFMGCTKLIDIDFSNFDTSKTINMGGMFCGEAGKDSNGNTVFTYLNMETIDLTNIDTSNVDGTGYSFMQMFAINNVKYLDLRNFNTSKVTNVQLMFGNCPNLETLELRNFDTKNLINCNSMFTGTNGIISGFKKLDLKSFNTTNVTSTTAMFQLCSNLTELNVENFDTKNVTNMAYMFNYCSALTKLDLSSFDTSNVTNMTAMFRRCKSLKKLDLSRFNTLKVTDMSTMFYQDSSLTELDISNFNTSNVTKMSFMFAANTGTNDADAMKLKKLDLRHFDVSKVTKFNSMFYRCEYLEELNITGWKTTSATTFSEMFNRCSSLKAVDVSSFDTSNVTDMNEMFSDCYELESLDLSNFNTSNVTRMASMFSADVGASVDNKVMKLKTLDLSSFDTSKVTDMSAMFNRCSNLTTIKVSSKWNTSAVTISISMFAECTALVGQNGTSYANILTTDADNANLVKYAVVDTVSTPGYLTLK